MGSLPLKRTGARQWWGCGHYLTFWQGRSTSAQGFGKVLLGRQYHRTQFLERHQAVGCWEEAEEALEPSNLRRAWVLLETWVMAQEICSTALCQWLLQVFPPVPGHLTAVCHGLDASLQQHFKKCSISACVKALLVHSGVAPGFSPQECKDSGP